MNPGKDIARIQEDHPADFFVNGDGEAPFETEFQDRFAADGVAAEVAGAQVVQLIAPDAVGPAAEEEPGYGNLGGGLDGLDEAEPDAPRGDDF